LKGPIEERAIAQLGASDVQLSIGDGAERASEAAPVLAKSQIFC